MLTSPQKLVFPLFTTILCLSLPLLSLSQSPPPLSPLNPRLEKAYFALQALKHSITSDPKNLTGNWCGPYVCNYTRVYCAPAPDDPNMLTVAALDLNHGDIIGTLPEDLGLLADLAIFHINSNKFSGTIPKSFDLLHQLYELDVSNNKLSGTFPLVLLKIPKLIYMDLRYNKFSGNIPKPVWDLKLDAMFLNNNNFKFALPQNLGRSAVSVLVIAHTKLSGCIPKTIGNMKNLNQIILMNTSLGSCLPPEIGKLKNLTVLDLSYNNLEGQLPESFGELESLEQLDVAHNKLSGDIPASICELPKLENFTYSYNYFCGAPQKCMMKIKRVDDTKNCIVDRPRQRSEMECKAFLEKPVKCKAWGNCYVPVPVMLPPPHPPPLSDVHY